MAYKDLRGWLELVDDQGELKRLSGAHWNLEMAGLAELAMREAKEPVPAILFDDIVDYPRGFRALFNPLTSPRRLAIALGLPPEIALGPRMDLVRACLDKIRRLDLTLPRYVESGPVHENMDVGEEINLYKFPVGVHHELDGGRYIGTDDAVITRDPDTGWVNLGTYRCMVIDRDKFALHMNPGRHGRFMRDERYFARGEPMPVAIAIGIDPVLFIASATEVSWGVGEYDYAGGLKGEPIEVIEGPYTKLPLPAHAEIVIEGECYPGELHLEGPFGEFCGYYANCGLKPVPEPVVHVKAILYRNDPILTCAHPGKPPSDNNLLRCIYGSALLWDALEKAGIPGVQGVWKHEAGAGVFFQAIAIRQLFAGHSRQVGAAAAQSKSSVHMGRYTVVVDEDIDPTNLADLIWAVATRTNPERSIEILRWCASSSADPAIPPDKKEGHNPGDLYTSKAIIDACWPYEWKDQAYPVAQISPELRGKLLERWGGELLGE